MFRDAKVGDRVWGVRHGWGEVSTVDSSSEWPIEVMFEAQDDYGEPHQDAYTFSGRLYQEDCNPTLFWDEIKFEVPEKPARLMDRTFEGWVNLYRYDAPCFQGSKKSSDEANSGRIGCYEVVVTLKGVPEGTNLDSTLEGLLERA